MEHVQVVSGLRHNRQQIVDRQVNGLSRCRLHAATVLHSPSGGRRPHTKGPSVSWPKRVLAAIELNDRFPVDAGAAAAVARGFGARLLVVTVVPSVQAPFWLTVEPNDGERARPGEARA